MRPDPTLPADARPAVDAAVVAVAGWRFDPLAQRLTRGAETRSLSYRAVQVLWRLHQEGGRPVTRQELIRFAWPGQRPTDVALSQVIVELRRALGDSARAPQHLLTVPRVGYRLASMPEDGGIGVEPAPRVTVPRRRVWFAALIALVLVVGVWRFLVLDPVPAAVPRSDPLDVSAVPVPVAFSSDGERMPDLSHDARHLVYAVQRGAGYELHLLELGAGPARVLTRGARDVWPRFARDGRIAFQRAVAGAEGRFALHVLDPASGQTREIVQAPIDGSMDWTPDGRGIVAGVRDERGRVAAQVFEVETGVMRPLPEAASQPDAGFVGEPLYSPDGQRLLLRVGRFPASRLLLIDLRSGERRFVDSNSRVLVSYAWRDGSQLLLSAQARGRNGLWHVDLGSGRWRHLRDEPLSRITAAAGRVVFPRPVGRIALVRMGIDAGTPVPFPRSAFDSYLPRFLGDSEEVVFLSLRSGSEQFWRRDAAGTESLWLPLQDASVLGFDVDARGQRLAFVQEDDAGLALQHVDLRDPRPRRTDLPGFLHVGALVLLPDSDEVLCLGTHAEDGAGIFSLWPDGRRQRRIGGDDFEDLQRAPDGSVFLARRTPSGYYRVAHERGTLQLERAVPAPDLLRWRVRSDGIVFFARIGPDQPAALHLHRFGSEATQLLRPWPLPYRPSSFDLHQDQVIVATADSMDVNLMLWDLPQRGETRAGLR